MSKIKSRGTKVELQFKELLRGYKFRYQPKAFGKPDFASKKLKTVIFIDGCFWHKSPKHFRMPKSNVVFWKNKINGNLKRDSEITKNYECSGWKVVRIWSHDLESGKIINKKISDLL